MESVGLSAHDRLDQLLHDGKINRDEYERLRSSLSAADAPPDRAARQNAEAAPRGLPWQVWVVIAVLGFFGIGDFMDMPTNESARLWFAMKCLQMIGLFKGWKWVFALAVFLLAEHALYFATVEPVVALINFALLALLVSVRRYYFPKKTSIENGIKEGS